MKAKDADRPTNELRRFKGRVHVYNHSKYGLIARKWPRSGYYGNTPEQQTVRDQFKQVVAWIKDPEPIGYASAINMSEGSAFMPRDVLAAAAYGTLIDAYLADGTYIQGVRAVGTSISSLLDEITSTPGSMLYRSTTGWIAVDPGATGDVLEFRDTTLPPQWTVPPWLTTAVISITATSSGVTLTHAPDAEHLDISVMWNAGQVDHTGPNLVLQGGTLDALDSNSGGLLHATVAYGSGNDGLAFAIKGNEIIVRNSLVISRVYCPLNFAGAGNVFRSFLFKLNAGFTVANLQISNAVTAAVNGTYEVVSDFTTGNTFAPGDTIGVCFGLTNAAGTTAINVFRGAGAVGAELMGAQPIFNQLRFAGTTLANGNMMSPANTPQLMAWDIRILP